MEDTEKSARVSVSNTGESRLEVMRSNGPPGRVGGRRIISEAPVGRDSALSPSGSMLNLLMSWEGPSFGKV